MNIKRKIVSLIVIFSILCSLSAFAANNPEEVSTADCGAECYEFLKAVDIIDDDEIYSAGLTVTRGHFVALSLGLAVLNTDILNNPSSLQFIDVSSSYKYASEIEAAGRLGLISGSSDGRFEPEAPITLSQSVKIICEVLGYTHMAEAMGGYPSGYMAIAAKLEILSGINADANSPMTMSDVMCLLKNAVNADVMMSSSYGDRVEYTARRDCTVLSERKGIEVIEGVVCDNGITNLRAPESEIAPDCVRIGQTILKDSENYGGKYPGYNVRAYYDSRSNSTYKPVLYVEVCEDNIAMECTDLNSLTVKNGTAEYEPDEDSVKKVRISPEASYILNGKMTSMTSEKLTDVKKGSIQFLSNDGDKIADVVIITSYETYVVSGVSTLFGCIVCEDGTVIELDKEDKSYTFEIFSGDSEIYLSGVKPGNVILAATSEGAGTNVKRILVSDESVSGKVTSVSDEKITVEQTEYPADTGVVSKVKTGKYYLFKIDSFGNIASADTDKNTVYGYLYGLKKETFGNIRCKIFTEKNRWVELDFDSAVSFNGVMQTEEGVYAQLGTVPEEYRGLIRYRVNNKGQIRLIETPGYISPTSPESANAEENDVFRMSYEGSLKWRSTPKCFDSIVWLQPSTLIFSVPDGGDADEIRIVSSSKLEGIRHG